MNSLGSTDSPGLSRPPRWAIAVLLAVAAWFVGTHLVHVFTEAINWDEFALLDRAQRSLRTGQVIGGGRPGLVSVWLMPFVRDCTDSVRAVVNARLLWQVITVLYLVGVFALVRRWFLHSGRPKHGRVEGAFAVALLAFIPAFVTWSVQVRTDQPALAAAVWGGVFLLSTGYACAAAAGVLFAVGLLCTQKALYVVALCGLLYATATAARALRASSSPRAEFASVLGRTLAAAVVALTTVWAYSLFVPNVSHLTTTANVAAAADAMQWYRERQGYRVYTVHAFRLVVHWTLFVVLSVWTAWVLMRRDRNQIIVAGTAWLVLLLGAIVVQVHGSRFPYFWMTAGLYLAVSLALPVGSVLSLAGRLAWPTAVSFIALTASQSAAEAVEMLSDTQRAQRETMRLVATSPLQSMRGYQVEGALFCSQDPVPLPAMFSQDISRRFQASPSEAEKFISRFRGHQIAYIVESYRLSEFPANVQDFWREHYIWYAGSLFVAGSRIRTYAEQSEIEILVPAEYQWIPDRASAGARIRIGTQVLGPLDTTTLGAGRHTVAAVATSGSGTLTLADLPQTNFDSGPDFYIQRQLSQLLGER